MCFVKTIRVLAKKAVNSCVLFLQVSLFLALAHVSASSQSLTRPSIWVFDRNRPSETNETAAINAVRPIIGFNQRWNFLPVLDDALLTKIEMLKPEMIRYPGGILAHYWDWRTGKQWPSDVPHPVEDIKTMADATNAGFIFVLDIVNRSIEDQISMLTTIQNLGVNIGYIELGNELYYGKNQDRAEYEEAFPTGAEYATKVTEWTTKIKEIFPTAKVSAVLHCGDVENKVQRVKKWNELVVSGTISSVDAYTYHIYISKGESAELEIQEFEAASNTANTGDKELWITEYGNTNDDDVNYLSSLDSLANYIEANPKITIALNHLIVGSKKNKLTEDGLNFTPEGNLFLTRAAVRIGKTVTAKSGSLSWESPNAWIGDAVPLPEENAVIPSGTEMFINSNVKINSLSSSGSITILENQSFEVALSFTNRGSITNNGTLRINSNFINNGTFLSGNNSNLEFSGSGNMLMTGEFSDPLKNIIHSGNGNLLGNTSFTLSGSYTNSGLGVGNFSMGIVTFSGAGEIIDGGSSVSGTTFNGITISGTYSAAGNVNLVGVLTLADGAQFDADGVSNTANFTLKSTSFTSTGSIAELPHPSKLTGNITMERFYPSGSRRWQYLAFPFASRLSVADLQAAGFEVNGHFSSGSQLVNESMFTYIPDPNGGYWNGIGWGGGATKDYLLLNNVGYVALAYPNNAPSYISLRGRPAKGVISTITVQGSVQNPQSNLIPNPYPAPLNFKTLQNLAQNSGLLSTTVEVETNVGAGGIGEATVSETASYSSEANLCVNCTDTGWNGIIAPWQSFWVNATGNGNLTVTESMKAANLATYIGKTEQLDARDYVRICLISGKMKDESILLFREGAKETFNSVNDAKKRLSGDPVEGSTWRTYINIGTLKSDIADPLVFNFSPLLDCKAGTKKVELFVQVTGIGTHTLKFTDLDTFTLGYNITLFDKFLRNSIFVKNKTEYVFSTNGLPASYALDRFELLVAPQEIGIPVITIIGNKLSTATAPIIQWYKNGEILSGVTKEEIIVDSSGTYSVVAGYSAACTASSLPVVMRITGVNEGSNNILAYPNPTKGVIEIIVPNLASIGRITVTDLRGLEVNTVVEKMRNNSISINLSGQPAGIYFVNMDEGKSNHFVKIIKE